MSDLQTTWDAAVAECVNGHEQCTYGGMSAQHGYWLADEACERNHGVRCTWCGVEAETGFVGRTSGDAIYAVPACQSCADAWVAEHPEWKRPDPAPDMRSTRELLTDIEADYQAKLAALDPVTRAAWQEADRQMENMLLWGNPDGPPPGAEAGPQFTGIESLFGLDSAPTFIAPGPPAHPGPPRQRYNPATRKWEAVT